MPNQYLQFANKSFDAITRKLIEEDKIGRLVFSNICGAYGLGGKPYREGDYNYYINEKCIVNDQKGVAPFILAAIELDK